MAPITNRRVWLKQSALALAGLGLTPPIIAKPYLNRSGGIDPGTILLNSNENAYGPSPMAGKAMMDGYLLSNRYPDDLVPVLKKKIADHWKVSEENILLGAGSSEIIGLACAYVSQTKKQIVTCEPSYKVWNGQASAFGMEFTRNPLPRNGGDPERLYKPSPSTGMVYICNPNNPTGTVLDVDAVERFASAASSQTLVFIDEAYSEYGGLRTLAPLAVKNTNVIVAKTFSKVYGLAGARIGYAIAHPKTISTLSSFQSWPNASVSAVSHAAAIASLDDRQFVNDTIGHANEAKQMCYDTFKQLGFDYIPSSTNFILFNIDKIVNRFTEVMNKRNIQVQYRDHYDGKWCRVTMGTIEEMKVFCGTLKEMG